MTPGSSREHPIVRPSARLLLLDPSDRALLFNANTLDEETGLTVWFTPGGGVEPGESEEETARRELWEETGLTVPLGSMVWRRNWLGALGGVWYHATEPYFLVRTGPESRITTENWTELEVREIKAHRWWSGEEILAATGVTAVFAPRCLGEILAPIVRGEIPQEPIVVTC